MVSIAEIDLFGAELPSFDDLKKLSLFVNCSEMNKIAFAANVEAHQDNPLTTGIGLFILGRVDEATEKLNEADDCKEKFMYLGYACSRNGDCDNAIKNFDKAAKKQADALMVTLSKADALRKAGQLDKAADELKGCSNFEKVSAEYHFQLARLKDAQGLYDEAMANYEIAIELEPAHQHALFHMAYACDLRGDDEAAIDYYKQITKNSPVYVNAMLNLSVLYEDRADYDLASKYVDMVLRSHPNHKKAMLFRKDVESSMVMIYDEEKEKRQNIHNKILEIPISDFELSVRSRNCLKKMNIITLGDLLRTTEADLLSYKNFGETSLVEIKKILDQKGLSLGMALEEQQSGTGDDLSEISRADEELLNKPVEDMELSIRAKRALSKLGVRTVVELINKTEAELLGCKNFGVTSLNEIKERLVSYDLSLRTLE